MAIQNQWRVSKGRKLFVISIYVKKSLVRGSVRCTKGWWRFCPPKTSQQSTVDKAPTVVSSDCRWGLSSELILSAKLDLIDPCKFGLDRSAEEKRRGAPEERKQFLRYILSTLAQKVEDVSIQHHQ